MPIILYFVFFPSLSLFLLNFLLICFISTCPSLLLLSSTTLSQILGTYFEPCIALGPGRQHWCDKVYAWWSLCSKRVTDNHPCALLKNKKGWHREWRGSLYRWGSCGWSRNSRCKAVIEARKIDNVRPWRVLTGHGLDFRF